MNLRTFRGEKSKYEPECRQLQEICSVLADDPSEEEIFIATNFRLASGEVDCLILKYNSPILLELKAYQGEIFGSENGDWSVRSNDGKIIPMSNNVFQQANRHRQDFLTKWQRICFINFQDVIDQKEIRRVASWGYFKPGSRYSDEKINFNAVPWFKIVTRDTLIDHFQFLRNSYCLQPRDMELIMEDLGLKEAPINRDLPLPQDDIFIEYLQYAQIYYDQKEYAIAQRYVETCLQIDPGDKTALQLSNLISQFLRK
ncbi:MAG: NERD domain-containing protein [Methanoregulaceae archaeon]|jgi:hypothetical protein